MDKKKKELILIGILVPVLIIVIYNSVSSLSEEKPAGTAPSAPAPVEAFAPAGPPPIPRPGRDEAEGADEKILEMQAVVAEGPWQRDPFQPPPIRESERGAQDWKEFQLSGIISGRMAIINGESVAVGEEYQGYRLKQAEQYRIILEKDDESFILTLAEE
ncbi:MAG: hypothetical protein P9M08_00440 [Candidatus Erginobacter occultus]|nr:hypothetical protein [Candidatus Erginobacter occultus]